MGVVQFHSQGCSRCADIETGTPVDDQLHLTLPHASWNGSGRY